MKPGTKLYRHPPTNTTFNEIYFIREVRGLYFEASLNWPYDEEKEGRTRKFALHHLGSTFKKEEWVSERQLSLFDSCV